MKKKINQEVKYSVTYNPVFEAERKQSLRPHDRHQEMLEEHKQNKASHKEAHRKGYHKIKTTPHRMV